MKDTTIDFSIVKDRYWAGVINDAYNAIFMVDGGYEFVKNKPYNESWMYNRNSIVEQIHSHIKTTTHSGASIALTLRQVEYIIKEGKEDWYKLHS